MLISRLAPTPSGFLHIGNIYNFLITTAIVALNNGTLWLRIDDGDQGRVRDEYLQDIFECLNWLKINYDYGPRNVSEHKTHFSQSYFFESIKVSLQQEKDLELFSCLCSRKDILSKDPTGRYSGTCYLKKELLFDLAHSIRVKSHHFLPHNYFLNDTAYEVGPELHDLILWKKDQSPSYHLLSLLHDQKLGVNTIIRGEDLRDSTALQMALSKAMQLDFHRHHFFHHELLTHSDGSKISKSTNKANVKALVDQFSNVAQFFEFLSDQLKIKIHSTNDFIQQYDMKNWDELKISVH